MKWVGGALLGVWLAYLWINPSSPYKDMRDGERCGPEHHWRVISGPQHEISCERD